MLEEIKANFLLELGKIENLEDIKNIKANFLGKKSKINELMKNLSIMPINEKKEFGYKINELRNFINTELEKIENKIIKESIDKELKKESIDITLPIRQSEEGLIHPMSKVIKEIQDIFFLMGFSFTDGPELEDDYHCFQAPNIPLHHPARQMQDTFYIKNNENEIILPRTQTTSMQIREMENKKPPFKFITSGKVYRSEMDATHSPMFHQLEGVYINKNISLQDLKNCLITFSKKFFNLKEVPLRFRPSYFPFTSPSIEIDIKCKKGDGKITIGDGEDWIEILGAGMVHPNVLKNVNINPEEYQGFAFGIGIERMAMLKYGIRDIRNLYDGDIRFLRKYGFKIFE